MNNQAEETQKMVFEHFKDTDSQLFTEIVNCFVYESGTNNVEVSKEVENFLVKMEIKDDYVNYLSTRNNKYFSDRTLAEFIQNIKIGFLNASFIKFKTHLQNENQNQKKLKSDFKFVSSELTNILENLNEGEIYFYSKEKDAELLTKIKSLSNYGKN